MSSEEAPASPWQSPTLADWVAALLLVALCAGSWLVLARRPAGSQLVIDSPTQRQILLLDHDQVLYAEGPLGPSRIEVREGRVGIVSSPCPEQRCVLQGWIRRQGESTACLPNRIAVCIEGDGTMDALSR